MIRPHLSCGLMTVLMLDVVRGGGTSCLLGDLLICRDGHELYGGNFARSGGALVLLLGQDA
jgi:hypothetical protein